MGKSHFTIFKQIIDYYEDFESQEKNPDIVAFARWIIKNSEEESEVGKRVSRETNSHLYKEVNFEVKSLDEKARFLESVSRIARYHELYSRKALKDLVINTRLEFHFLQAIDFMEKARKTDLINTFNLEYTTGMDTIRRLNNNGLLNEVPDEADKRARLLVLTEKGEKVLAQASKRMMEENKMFLTAINYNKWKKALTILEEIDEFHSNVYQNHSNKSFAELNNLMDSLKYLYK